MKLDVLAKELEPRVPRRLAEERALDIGVSGHLDYFVDRGPLQAGFAAGALFVRTELRAHAEVCASGRCYASCDPIAMATATVPSRLTPEYAFAPSHLTLSFTRGCVVRALRGIVRVDVTPILQRRLDPTLRRIERDIDARMPRPRAEVERLWKELSTPRPLPFGACALVHPRGIVQGPASGIAEVLSARFALAASPEIRTRCGDPPKATSLPPLAYEPDLPAEDDLIVATVTPLDAALASLASPRTFDAGGASVRIATATGSAAGAAVDVDLSLRGEACGDVALRSSLAWSEGADAVRLDRAALAPGDDARLAAASVDAAAATRALASAGRIPLAATPRALADVLPSLASSLSDPAVEVRAKVGEAAPLDAFARGEDLVATVRLRGRVDVTIR